MTMNLDLARVYGTPGAATSEDLTKQAEAELFAKLAAQEGVDLNALNDEQIGELWNHVFPKTAEEEERKEEAKEEDEEKKEEEKKEAAAREHAIKLAQAEEEQRAHYLGQVMAHSYVAELGKIAAAQEAGEEGESKEAAMPEALAKALGKAKGHAGAAVGKAKAFGRKVSDSARSGAFDASLKANDAARKVKDVARKGVEHVKAHKGAYGAGAAGAAGAGAGFAAGRMSKKKESSAIDMMALEHAYKIAEATGGYDLEVVAEKLAAVHTLGLNDSDKLAATVDQQVEIRALEYLEAAGYPVEWAQ